MMATVLDTSNHFHNQQFGSAELRLQNYHYELEDSSERSSADDASLLFLGGREAGPEATEPSPPTIATL